MNVRINILISDIQSRGELCIIILYFFLKKQHHSLFIFYKQVVELALTFYFKAELESQPSKDYLDALKKLKDELNELESREQSIMNSLNDFSKAERALQQTKVGLLFLCLGLEA